MARHVQMTLELPDEVLPQARDEEIIAQVKEAFVMALLREHRVSQGTAAALLGMPRTDLFALMTVYRVPVIDMTPEELAADLAQPWPQA